MTQPRLQISTGSIEPKGTFGAAVAPIPVRPHPESRSVSLNPSHTKPDASWHGPSIWLRSINRHHMLNGLGRTGARRGVLSFHFTIPLTRNAFREQGTRVCARTSGESNRSVIWKNNWWCSRNGTKSKTDSGCELARGFAIAHHLISDVDRPPRRSSSSAKMNVQPVAIRTAWSSIGNKVQQHDELVVPQIHIALCEPEMSTCEPFLVRAKPPHNGIGQL